MWCLAVQPDPVPVAPAVAVVSPEEPHTAATTAGVCGVSGRHHTTWVITAMLAFSCSLEVFMSGKSGTRAIKNAKFIRAVSPDLFPTGEPQAGYASVVPFAVLDRFDRMSDEELRPYPQLRTAAHVLRRKQQASKRRASSKLRRFLRGVLG